MGAGAGAEQLKENEKVLAKLIILAQALLFILGYFEKTQGGSKKPNL